MYVIFFGCRLVGMKCKVLIKETDEVTLKRDDVNFLFFCFAFWVFDIVKA
jgi:hypothetical protein